VGLEEEPLSLPPAGELPPLADSPPEVPLEEPPPEDASPPLALEDSVPFSLSVPELEEEPACSAVEVLADLVDVDVVWVDSCSAEVLFGGVMSGVLLGVTSDTLAPPPHPPMLRPHRRIRTLAPSPRIRGG
jgi:hypothetical protein